MHSAGENPKVIEEYLEKEVAWGRVVGLINSRIAPPNTQISPFVVIPKSSQAGKWRLTVDLSSPEGASVNDGIEPDLCSLQYLRLDTVIQQVNRIVCGTMLAKMDIEMCLPDHPSTPRR